MKIYTDPRLLSHGLIGGTCSRESGNMRPAEDQNTVYENLQIPSQKILHFHQTHSDRIITIRSEQEALNFQQLPTQDADGWVLQPQGWGAAILTADCVPLFLWDEIGETIGLSHCGWRGVVQQMPAKTVRTMRDCGAKGKIYAWAGPHIQSCCFEVGADVAAQFSEKSSLFENGKHIVSLNVEIAQQLIKEGLLPADIQLSSECTCCQPDKFFSWRRDHVLQNLLSFVYRP